MLLGFGAGAVVGGSFDLDRSEESDEALFWLMLIGRSGMSQSDEQTELTGESRELLAIFTQSAKTASENNRQ